MDNLNINPFVIAVIIGVIVYGAWYARKKFGNKTGTGGTKTPTKKQK